MLIKMERKVPMEFKLDDLYVMKKEQIDQATEKQYRQYFCGNLQKPQLMDFVLTKDLEIGISWYREFSTDKPHFHHKTADMIYVLEGIFAIYIVQSGNTVELRGGDFISIPPQTAYASKASAGTRTLFIKDTKGVNDKELIVPEEKVAQWLKEEI